MTEAAPRIILDGNGLEVSVVPIQPSAISTKDRQTCRLTFYHETFGEEASAIELIESYMLNTIGLEPVVKKRMRPTEEWRFLPLGDLAAYDVGEIIIQNTSGKNLQVKPTDEELANHAKQIFRVREVGVPSGLEIIIEPGRFQKFHVNKTNLEIRCESGEGRGYIWVYPR